MKQRPDIATDERFMRVALDACTGPDGQPHSCFGACVVRGNEPVVSAYNDNTGRNLPTRHGEINAIEQACEALGTASLTGCTLYTTCEPCPMCFTAAYWADVERIVYGATIADAEAVGFRQLTVACDWLNTRGGGKIRLTGEVLRAECVDLFRRWQAAHR